jgi:phosphoribosylformylglycinamidine synthase
MVGVLGVIDDVRGRVPHSFHSDRAPIYLLGDTRDEFGGSEWHAIHGFLGGRPPSVDLAREQLLAGVLIDAGRRGLIDAAHDLSEGGLGQALVEACLRYGVGARVELDEVCDRDGVAPFAALFAESTGRAVVAVRRREEVRFTELCASRKVPFARIGVVDGGDSSDGADTSGDGGDDGGPVLAVQGLFTVPLAELRRAREATLPAVLDA